MTANFAIDPDQLYRSCDPDQFPFNTTAELDGLEEIIGQMRAMDAVHFGAGIRHDGFNLFVLGPSGMGKRSMVREILEKKAQHEQGHADWCYVNNFTEPHKPIAIKLPTGRGAELRNAMKQLVDDLRAAVPSLFQSEEYQTKIQAIQEEFGHQQEKAFQDLGNDAQKEEIVLLRTPGGFAFAPAKGEEVMPPDEYQQLPEEKRKQIEAAISNLQDRMEKILRSVPQSRKELSDRVKQLHREIMLSAVGHMMDEVRACFADLPDVLTYLDAVQQDMVEHVDDFRRQEAAAETPEIAAGPLQIFPQYQVNVLVSNGKQSGAPIVSEDNPTYPNLVGRVEHIAQMGALVTNFTLIKPGAMHRANSGYLLLDVQKVLTQPFAWEGLKRALKSREIHIESLGQVFSLVSTVSLEPQPIPLDIKIVLFGDRLFYYLLQQYDPEFGELFKVAADFEDEIKRDADSQLLYARLISTLSHKDNLLPFDRSAVARVIEHGARLAGDSERLSAHMRSIADLLRESDYWARQSGHEVVSAADVQHAIDMQIRRQDRVRDRLHEEILRNTLMIDTDGAVPGQINGLSVLQLGSFAFAQPTRITANVRLGEGELINIEREAKLSGAIHSKGVLIMSSFLAARYAGSQPLALSASLVFEQSYGMVDGDSASMAELCAILTRLANAPVRQSLSMTGSVNQFGQTQAIGGVNEKIEGFFDICNARGLNGEQGVLIPTANVKHLMLRHDVVDTVRAGKFHVYAYENVDQALTILTGVDAGAPDEKGGYPESTINGMVAARLAELTRIREKFAIQAAKEREAAKKENQDKPDAL